MCHAFVRMSYRLTTYHLSVLLPLSYFRKMGISDFSACNNVRNIWYITDVITSTVKLFVHSPVGKLV